MATQGHEVVRASQLKLITDEVQEKLDNKSNIDHTHIMDNITDLPEWTKEPTKPTYTAEEVGAAPASHTHGTATQSSAGFMSANDKIKLDNLDTLGGGFDIDLVYPVGSVYLSMANVDPATLFGGTWSKLEGRFLLTSDSNHEAGNIGGSNDAVVVEHTHVASAEEGGNHSHGISIETGGAHIHTATMTEEGDHTHTVNSGGSHSHQATSTAAGSHSHTCGNPDSQFVRSSSSRKPSCLDTTSTASPYFYTELWTNTSTSGSHSHSIQVISTGSSHTHTMQYAGDHTHDITIRSNGSHSHVAEAFDAGNHTHDVTVQSTGSDGTGLNMPAYLVVNAWQRTA